MVRTVPVDAVDALVRVHALDCYCYCGSKQCTTVQAAVDVQLRNHATHLRYRGYSFTRLTGVYGACKCPDYAGCSSSSTPGYSGCSCCLNSLSTMCKHPHVNQTVSL